VSNGPDVVFHDLIETTECFVFSPVPQGKTLAEEAGIGCQSAIAPPDSGEAELVNAGKLESNGKIYYLLSTQLNCPITII